MKIYGMRVPTEKVAYALMRPEARTQEVLNPRNKVSHGPLSKLLHTAAESTERKTPQILDPTPPFVPGGLGPLHTRCIYTHRRLTSQNTHHSGMVH